MLHISRYTTVAFKQQARDILRKTASDYVETPIITDREVALHCDHFHGTYWFADTVPLIRRQIDSLQPECVEAHVGF